MRALAVIFEEIGVFPKFPKLFRGLRWSDRRGCDKYIFGGVARDEVHTEPLNLLVVDPRGEQRVRDGLHQGMPALERSNRAQNVGGYLRYPLQTETVLF